MTPIWRRKSANFETISAKPLRLAKYQNTISENLWIAVHSRCRSNVMKFWVEFDCRSWSHQWMSIRLLRNSSNWVLITNLRFGFEIRRFPKKHTRRETFCNHVYTEYAEIREQRAQNHQKYPKTNTLPNSKLCNLRIPRFWAVWNLRELSGQFGISLIHVFE